MDNLKIFSGAFSGKTFPPLMNEIDALNAAADKGVNKQQQQSSEMEYIGN